MNAKIESLPITTRYAARSMAFALVVAGIEVRVTSTSDIHAKPTPPRDLLNELRGNKAAILALLTDPDRHGWQMPGLEAMEAARKVRRVALYVPPAIDLAAPGGGNQFKIEMERLAAVGLVILAADPSA